MNEQLYTPQQLSKLLNVSPSTLKHWEVLGKIKASKKKGGYRRYLYSVPEPNDHKKSFIYARVSSQKQKADLERQVATLKATYPTFEVVKDIGSGINFKRRGLLTLLDRLLTGNVSQVVVAHRDRLTRFGFELFELLFKRFGATLTVLSDSNIKEPISELATDLLSIVTVFTAKYYGSRKYQILQKDKVLPVPKTSSVSKPVSRSVKILLQQGSRLSKQARRQRTLDTSQAPTSCDDK